MTPFEFVFALISIITSLALTKIITGVVAIIRHKDRAGFSLIHALWVWIAFAVVIGNWGTLWGARIDPDWQPARVLAWMASMTSLYAFCALVVPDVEPDAKLNLTEFHEREGTRYILAHNLFVLLVIVLIVAVAGITPESVGKLVPASFAFVVGSVAWLARGRLQLAASILLAVSAASFMVLNIGIVAGRS
jgi:hypothetical protein